MRKIPLTHGFFAEVDHRDHNGLNNQRQNLRSCTQSLNNANANIRKSLSGYRGVAWDRTPKRKTRPWRALLTLNRKGIHLGWFATPEEAALAYDKAAVQIFGEFARPNFK